MRVARRGNKYYAFARNCNVNTLTALFRSPLLPVPYLRRSSIPSAFSSSQIARPADSQISDFPRYPRRARPGFRIATLRSRR